MSVKLRALLSIILKYDCVHFTFTHSRTGRITSRKGHDFFVRIPGSSNNSSNNNKKSE